MISSEVQRTLVKSPPELWAELSDPAALARHLGELGEIRITRAKAEELVEWESQDAIGTIAIKPSAWGTRVTLTVARELPANVPGSEGDAVAIEPQDATSHEAEGNFTTEPEGVADPVAPELEPVAALAPEITPEPEITLAPEVTLAPEITPEPEAIAAPEPSQEEAHAQPPPITAIDEIQLPPATAAGALATWAQQESEWGSAPSDALGEPAPDFDPDPDPDTDPEAEASRSLEELEAPAFEPSAMFAEPIPPSVPRRGFLARLFGRRRAESKSTFNARGPGPDAELTIAREAARRRLEATLAGPQAPEPIVAETESPEHLSAEADPHGPPEPAAVEFEAEITGLPEPTAVEVDAEPLHAAEPVHAEAVPEAPHAAEPVHAEAEPEAPHAAEPIHAEAEPEAHHAPEPDLAAELRAAEETAAEEVEAVLTAVLDRLGAAHHRPFSRG